jgi:hypothetical protein
MPNNSVFVQALHPIEPLQQPYRDVTCFDERKLLTDADSRTSIELFAVSMPFGAMVRERM